MKVYAEWSIATSSPYKTLHLQKLRILIWLSQFSDLRLLPLMPQYSEVLSKYKDEEWKAKDITLHLVFSACSKHLWFWIHLAGPPSSCTAAQLFYFWPSPTLCLPGTTRITRKEKRLSLLSNKRIYSELRHVSCDETTLLEMSNSASLTNYCLNQNNWYIH